VVALVIESLARSGMRLGEALAMHSDHLDVRNSQYLVSETVKNARFGLPKNGKRLIDLPTDLVKKLEKRARAVRSEE